MKKIPAVTSEIKTLLVGMRNEKKNKEESVAIRKKDFTESASNLLNEVEGWFECLLDVGVSSKRKEIKIQGEFGNGLEEIISSNLVVEFETLGEVLVLEPFRSDIEKKANKLRFRVGILAQNKKTLVFWPNPLDNKVLAKWYFWENEDNKSEAPIYQLFDEEYVMELIKSRLT